jgi:uncharacterized membrane protein YqgA involved in biofilm formation
MLGTLINFITVVIGGVIGTLIGHKIPEKIRQAVMVALGLFTIGYGIKSFLQTQNVLISLASLIFGVLLGEWWQLERGLGNIGEIVKEKTSKIYHSERMDKFVDGFVTASLVFCIGPMTILGSLEDGLDGNSNLLIIKAIMDGFAAIAFSSTLGYGVIFSAIFVLIYQGSISLTARFFGNFVSEPMIIEMTAVGGIILIGIAISGLLEIKKIRVANFLPALILAPLIVWVLGLLSVNY